MNTKQLIKQYKATSFLSLTNKTNSINDKTWNAIYLIVI